MEDGRRLTGSAVFRASSGPAQLMYSVECDVQWRSRRGTVVGWIGDKMVNHTIERSPIGEWTLNGAVVSDLHAVVDLDLGFTPATNLLQLRRLDLAVGRAGDAPAAWLDVETGTMDLLPQRYARRSETTYWYEAPRFDYTELLEVTAAGFVRRYPKLWEAEG
jgi:hypothetical protein